MKFQFTLVLSVCFLSSFGQKVTPADSLWFAETAAKTNQFINENPQKADSFARAYFAKARALHNDDYTGKGACLVQMSVSLLEPEKAKAWYDTAQVYLQRSENYLWSGYLNMNYGTVLNNRYNFESGISYLNKSITCFEQAKDTTQLAFAYCNIAHAFHDFGNYEKGKEYAFKGLSLIESHKNHPAQWWLLTALGINYDDNKEYNLAITTHQKAVNAAAGKPRLLSSTYNNLGNTYKKKGMFTEAETHFRKSFECAKKLHDSYQSATLYGNLGDLARLQKKYAVARKYLDSCLYYSEKSESPEKLKDAYEYNAYWYEETGDYKNSLRSIRQFNKLKDSLENVAKAGIIYDAQERYETEKKERQNQQLQLENQLQTSEKNKAVTEKKIILTASVTLMIMLAALAYSLYRNKLNKIKRSEEQKMNQALFVGEQNERIRIARDLHDSVGQMLSLAKMNLSTIAHAGLQQTVTLIDNTISEVRNISHNLIPEDLNFGLFPALETLADKINRTGTTKMKIHIDEPIRQQQFRKENELSIYRIMQEVVNNMIRHSGANHIELTVTRQHHKILLSVRDNGKGMDAESIENSKGLGWKNIKARVHLLDGEMKVQSEKLAGTQIEIILPGNETR